MDLNDYLVRIKDIAKPLLSWYGQNARALPWRDEPSPYRVLVSEVMLQQTRVYAVIPYFERFVRELPDFNALADCPEDRLMKLWEGLGYYSRARNLQKAARIVVKRFNGSLPASYEELLTLPGIGGYAAGAVASIAFSLPVPAVDGNVLRVLSRVAASSMDITLNETKTAFFAAVEQILPADCPGDFNQALMELGAILCRPNGAPQCSLCPLSDLCEGRKKGIAGQLPVKALKKARKTEQRTVLVLLHNQKVAINKRGGKGLLSGLYELPSFKGRLSEEEAAAELCRLGVPVVSAVSELSDAKHVFTHIEWHMKGFLMHAAGPVLPEGWIWADRDMLNREYALPSVFNVYRKNLLRHL